MVHSYLAVFKMSMFTKSLKKMKGLVLININRFFLMQLQKMIFNMFKTPCECLMFIVYLHASELMVRI